MARRAKREPKPWVPLGEPIVVDDGAAADPAPDGRRPQDGMFVQALGWSAAATASQSNPGPGGL